MFSGDEIGLSSNSNDVDSSFRCIGFDLLGAPIFEKVVRWRLLGFIVRALVLWHDKAVFHKVRGSDSELVQQRFSNGEGAPDLFDVSSRVVVSSSEQRRFALSDNDNSCCKLSDF